MANHQDDLFAADEPEEQLSLVIPRCQEAPAPGRIICCRFQDGAFSRTLEIAPGGMVRQETVGVTRTWYYCKEGNWISYDLESRQVDYRQVIDADEAEGCREPWPEVARTLKAPR